MIAVMASSGARGAGSVLLLERFFKDPVGTGEAVFLCFLFIVVFGALVLKINAFLDGLLGEAATINEKRLSDAVHAAGSMLLGGGWLWLTIPAAEGLLNLGIVSFLVYVSWIVALFWLLIPSFFGLGQAALGRGYKVVEQDGKRVIKGWS